MPDIGGLRFGDVADVISVISGIMTILGVSGLVTWGFFTEQRGTLAENAISVFALSVKVGVCALLLWPMSLRDALGCTESRDGSIKISHEDVRQHRR